MPIISERETVIAHARRLHIEGNELSEREASAEALQSHFDLADGAGIWSGSEAAICMGYVAHAPGTDLFETIAEDVSRHLG
jgi:hypothetical protein